jgi:hypothetical protein
LYEVDVVPRTKVLEGGVDRAAEIHGDDGSAVVQNDLRETPQPATGVENQLSSKGPTGKSGT